MFERIVVPLDGSAAAEEILSSLRPLLRVGDPEVILVGAIEEAGDAFAVVTPREATERYLEDQERRLSAEGVRVRRRSAAGRAAQVILESAAAEKASLIAMSTHGRSGLARWVCGSVAEDVLRQSPVPVFLARTRHPGEAPRPPGAAIRRILVPLDPSDASMAGLPCAADLARLFGAEIVILHVCSDAGACTVPVPQLTRAYEKFRDAGLSVEPILEVGDPAEKILAAARERKADLIAMASRGRAGLSRWLEGSVLGKVLHDASVPVLAVCSRNAPAGIETAAADVGV